MLLNKAKKKLNLFSRSTKWQLSLVKKGDGSFHETLETKLLLFIQLHHSKIKFPPGADLQQESD